MRAPSSDVTGRHPAASPRVSPLGTAGRATAVTARARGCLRPSHTYSGRGLSGPSVVSVCCYLALCGAPARIILVSSRLVSVRV